MTDNPETKPIEETKEVTKVDDKDHNDDPTKSDITESSSSSQTNNTTPANKPPPPPQQNKGRINFPKVPNKEALIGMLESGNAKFSLLKDTINFDNYRVYFHINTQYITEKLKRVLFPHFFCDKNTLWAQKYIKSRNGNGEHAPPAMDINAPDLYIPLMAFATYLLLCVFLYGLAGYYSTSLFEQIAAKAGIVVAIETLLVKGALYLLTDHDMSVAEIVGYCGYVFVSVCLNIVANVFVGRKLSMILMCFFALEMSCFLKRTFSVIIMRTSHVKQRNVKKGNAYEIVSRRVFIAFICLLQFVVSYYLSYYY